MRLRVAFSEGHCKNFSRVIDLILSHIEKTDQRIDGKIGMPPWDEVQRLSKLRQEFEDLLSALNKKRET